MQLTETKNDGLQREFKVVVPANTLVTRADQRLNDIKGRVRIDGFRPGKVPVGHLKRLYGRSVMAEVVNETVTQATRTLSTEKQLKLAGEPKINFPDDEKTVEAVIEGKADLAFSMEVEVLPKIDLGDFKKIKLTKDTTEVTQKDIDEAMTKIADQARPYEPKKEGAKAEKGDRLQIDYLGSIDGVPFEGGKDEGAYLVLGSNQFIPGFEDQLIGTKVGDDVTVKVTFPDPYAASHLAGKAAEFAVKVKGIEAPGDAKIDDEFAKSLGLENLDKLKEAITDRLKADDSAQARRKLKRKLLDALDETYNFELPPSLVDGEFDIIWRNVMGDLQRANRSFADEGTTEDEAKAEYRTIAERRVRLGLLLAEVGEANKIEVKDDELNKALVERIRQFPGQEKQVFDFYQKNPQALAELRAPLFEEKVVDYILELAEVTENKVVRDVLYASDEEEIKASTKKKTAAKKSTKKAD